MQVNQAEDLANLAAAYESGINPFAFSHELSEVTDCDYCGNISLCHEHAGGTRCKACKQLHENELNEHYDRMEAMFPF